MDARSAEFTNRGSVRPGGRKGRPKDIAGRTHGAYEVELRSGIDVAVPEEAWRALAERALERNVFADPDMLLAAMQHLPDGRQAALVLVWQETPLGRVLRGLIPVLTPRLSLMLGEIRVWRPKLMPLPGVLIDRERPREIVEAALSFLASRGSRCAGLLLPRVYDGGPLARTLAAAAAATGRPIESFATVPVLVARADAAAAMPEGCCVERARTAREVRDALETFLVIEAAAARADAKPALLRDPGATSFLRTVTRHLARRRACRVEVMTVDGVPQAAAVVLETTDGAWLWQLAATPEGAPLVGELVASIEERARRKPVFVADGVAELFPSLAPDLDRLAASDILVATRPGGSAGALTVRLKERLGRRLRAFAGALPSPALRPRRARAAG